MKTIILTLALLVTSTSVYAESPIEPPMIEVTNAIEAGNLINKKAVRNCLSKIESAGYNTMISAMHRVDYNILTRYTVNGLLRGGDIIAGRWGVIINVTHPFDLEVGDVRYECQITHNEIF